MRILAGDIGGTKTILQLCDYVEGRYTQLAEQRFESNAYQTFDSVLHEFINASDFPAKSIDAACIGVAGPVTGQTASVTNLTWIMDSRLLSEQFQIPRFYLINDFQAVGYGIDSLLPADLLTLQTGDPRQNGVRAVIGAGTGLGQATLIWDNNIGSYRVYASEAGHASFAPTSTLQIELLQFLSGLFDCVSIERVLSGPGITNIFNFLREKQPSLLSSQLEHALSQPDLTPVIVEYALQGKDPVAVQTLDLFIEIYGSVVGNLALTALPSAGVYIAGGIAPRIINKLPQGSFMQAFLRKSKMSSLLGTIPVYVVNNAKVGLFGAANFAVKGESLTNH